MNTLIVWIILMVATVYSAGLIFINCHVLWRSRLGRFSTLAIAIVSVLMLGDGRVSAATPATQPAANLAPDRKAILALAGAFKVDFSFQETVALKVGYQLKAPYRSQATELVLVINDQPARIELQHLLVADGIVVKHWRQEWLYENRDLLEFKGNHLWVRRTLSESEAAGTWTQRVSGVEDAPRYEGFGKWEHGGNWMAWESSETWRPLPRREARRTDYHVIIGRNRHLLTPNGWVHEQDNGKVALDPNGAPSAVVALERGLNSYTRCDPAQLKPAADYWEESAPFWQQVREAWNNVRKAHSRFNFDDKGGHTSLDEVLEPLQQRFTAATITPPEAYREIERGILRYAAP